MAKVLKESKIIMWDQCTMAHKRTLKALDRTFKNLCNDSRCFGGAMILLPGDFRQTMPVIPRSTDADEINACLKSVALCEETSTDNKHESCIAEWSLLKIYPSNSWLSVIVVFLSTNRADWYHFLGMFVIVSSKDELLNKVFPNIVHDHNHHKRLSERAILTAEDDLNIVIQNQIVGTLHSFKSIDCLTNEDEVTNYLSEFLNSLDVPGLPLHNLQLKVGSVVMMLQNLNQPKLCDGSHLVIKTDDQCDSRDCTQRQIQIWGSSHSEDSRDTNRYALWV
jgi:PIF1 helicase.